MAVEEDEVDVTNLYLTDNTNLLVIYKPANIQPKQTKPNEKSFSATFSLSS
jgi:hypothetical protein